MTYIVAIITAMLYAKWLGINFTDAPLWYRVFIGLIWGFIVVFAIYVDCGIVNEIYVR